MVLDLRESWVLWLAEEPKVGELVETGGFGRNCLTVLSVDGTGSVMPYKGIVSS